MRHCVDVIVTDLGTVELSKQTSDYFYNEYSKALRHWKGRLTRRSRRELDMAMVRYAENAIRLNPDLRIV